MDKKEKYVKSSMMKSYIFGMAAALMMSTAALSSCSSDELTVGNEAQIAKEVAKTYSFSVPATMDDKAGTRVFTITVGENEGDEDEISSAFSTTEPVYMFIEKEDGSNIAYGNKALYPTGVSEDGSTCTIKTPEKAEESEEDFDFIPKTPGFTVEEGDKVYLYYGMTVEPGSNPLEGYFDFTKNDGSKATAENMDYNKAVTTIKSADGGVLTFNDTFSFTNINSIFRQKLTIIDERGNKIDDYSAIEKLVILSANYKTVQRYYPFKDEAYEYGNIETAGPESEEGIIYFSLIFNNDNKYQSIVFKTYDKDDLLTHEDSKLPPNDPGNPGFQNNRYYYGEATFMEDHHLFE